jgi:Uma2 family endonuclease
MSAAVAEKKKWTAEEYLATERQSLDKHEFFDGGIFARAGARHEHNLIVVNLIAALKNALGAKCIVYPSDIRLHIPATGSYTYADVTVLCDKPEFTDEVRDTIKNPQAIFEVLSSSTESYDRGDKFENYRSIAFFKDYILVAQTKVRVEHFVRQPNGSWLMHALHAGDMVRLPCGEIAVESLYEQVELPQPASGRPAV